MHYEFAKSQERKKTSFVELRKSAELLAATLPKKLSMKGICALYEIEDELRESHIFPKFVVNHTKKTGSKYFRRLVEPDKRMQDAVKLHLLSHKAEQEFSLREKWFAENIFVPYLSGKTELPYNENLYYFAVSFLWRILVLELKRDENLKNKWYYETILAAEQEWKEFLKNGNEIKNYDLICIQLTDRVAENNTGIKGVDFYLTRAMDATIVDNQTQTCLMIYGKFNRFMFWAVLKKYGDEDKAIDSIINKNGGTIIVPQKFEYFPIVSFIFNRMKEVENLPRPNQDQQDKIFDEIMKDPEKFWKSDVGQSLYNDNFNLD